MRRREKEEFLLEEVHKSLQKYALVRQAKQRPSVKTNIL
jgi:hypothetical protein